jgi:hypothetical protein
MTTFTKTSCKSICADIEAAVQAVADKHGVSIKRGNASFSESTITLKVEVSTIGDDGTVNTKEAEAFTKEARWFDIDPAALGRVFDVRGKSYTIVGFKPRSRKYPILGRDNQGGVYKFPADLIARHFPLPVRA